MAREQLLDLKHISMNPRDTQTHTRLSRSTLAHPDPPTSQQNPILLHNHPRNYSTPPTQGTRRKSLGEWHSGIVTRSLASSHETSRSVSTLPKINKNGIPLVNDSCKTITTLLSRRDKLWFPSQKFTSQGPFTFYCFYTDLIIFSISHPKCKIKPSKKPFCILHSQKSIKKYFYKLVSLLGADTEHVVVPNSYS